jgi:hypothetical protein
MDTDERSDHRDRTTGLILFGIIAVLAGVLCAAMVPLTLAAVALGDSLADLGTTPMTLRTAAPSMALYGSLAVVLVWLGVGSVRCRRWARPLLLIIAWLWLAVGVLGMAVVVAIGPGIYSEMTASGLLSPGSVALVQVLTYGVVGLLYVVLPALMVLFYRSPDVAATCRVRDPQPRWTDDFPTAVLSLLVLYALTVVLILMMPAYAVVVPFFGLVLDGPVAWAIMLGSLFVCVWLGWETFRLRPSAWWCGVAVVSLASVSVMITFLRVAPVELYRSMQLPPEQLELLHRSGLDGLWLSQALVAVTWLSFVAYMVHVRRWFLAGE